MTYHLVVCLSQKTMWTLYCFSGGWGSVTNCTLFCSASELSDLATFVLQWGGGGRDNVPTSCVHDVIGFCPFDSSSIDDL